MNRILIDYRKLPHDVASLLIELYPHGYGDEDLIVLKKPNGEIIEAVEVKTNDTIYLVKISKSLANFISNFEETIEKELGNQESEPISNSELETEKGLEPEV
ncbi:MAG: hypothetical protein CMH48_03445 [Muricauda sp.]|uniref:Uncharacterized protein n=1 Tax=Flagellimonas lutaonensis TaxID=516051 RepID=A0A0D5YWI8_9FLAO|nr:MULTISPECIES: hypothetical protein [Allomuricauda]AKA36286.1 hypothetical protein VC82_2728 [Allomuricauda lutaonensis]MAU26143.1 hypothetical protein [Allomuricauda sp.]MBC29877.1 hypothetical protein [Allomuricauda sp.]|tara:strand:- start:300 stop:605 length:306 start_codon:yes stop_codon:yes gene_type:complete